MIPQSFTQARPRQLSSVLKFEVSAEYSRESGTLLAGPGAVLGQVLGKITASGKLVPLAPAAADGSQNVEGVLLHDVDANAADVENVLYAKRTSIVSGAGLVWPAGITAPQKATALAGLVALGIVVRA